MSTIQKHIRIDEEDVDAIEKVLDGRSFAYFVRKLIKSYLKQKRNNKNGNS